MLSEKSSKVLEQFFLQSEQFEQKVASMKPQELAQVLSEVLALYANDKNSSTQCALGGKKNKRVNGESQWNGTQLSSEMH